MNKASYEPVDRRPIKSRNTRWAEVATQFFVNLNVSPNAISIIGMLAAVTAGSLLYSTQLATGATQRALWLIAGLLCQVRLLCNLFDGMVAIKRGIASPKGELYNEVPDRISDVAVFIGLGYAIGSDITLGYVAALMSVFVAYVRAVIKATGAPNDYAGPMAKPQRMAVATLLAIYMTISPFSWRLSWGEPKLILLIVIVGTSLTAFRRLRRAVIYLERHAK